jgi:hypothetical protein
MRSEPQDTAQGPCWPRKPEFGGASVIVHLARTRADNGLRPFPNPNI